MTSRNDQYREVFSTDQGRLCPECNQPIASCKCVEAKRLVVQGDGQVRVRRETKGRGGKTVTTITGVPLPAGELEKLGKDLKKLCGAGGAVKDGVIEVQGDHCDTVLKELAKRGFQPKRAGG